jgi:hypothetical protein
MMIASLLQVTNSVVMMMTARLVGLAKKLATTMTVVGQCVKPLAGREKTAILMMIASLGWTGRRATVIAGLVGPAKIVTLTTIASLVGPARAAMLMTASLVVPVRTATLTTIASLC